MPKAESAGTKSAKARNKVKKTNRTAGEKPIGAGRETAEKAVEAGSEAAATAYDQALGAAGQTARKSPPQAAARLDDLAGMQRANLEALLSTGTAAMRSARTLSEEMLAFNRKSFDEGVANARKLMACKTLQEVVEMQAGLARAQIEQTLAHAGKVADLALKMAGDLLEPMQEAFGLAVEKPGKPRAA